MVEEEFVNANVVNNKLVIGKKEDVPLGSIDALKHKRKKGRKKNGKKKISKRRTSAIEGKIKIIAASVLLLYILVIGTVAIRVLPTNGNNGVLPTNNNSTRDIDETYSYLIYQNGGVIYAKNGITGVVEKSSSVAADTFTYAITHLPSSGGKIFLKAGTYSISYGLPIVQGLSITGEGIISTSITLSKDANCPLFSYNGSKNIYFFTLEHLLISCQAGATSGTAIKTNEHVNDGLLFDCFFSYFKGDGIDLGTTWGWKIDQSVFEFMGGDGIHLHGGCDAYITNSKIITNDGNGINLDGSCAVTMVGNYIGECGKNGVLFNNTKVCILTGNEFYLDDKNSTGLYSDIYVTGNSKHNIICSNEIEGESHSQYNIYLGGTSSTKNIVSMNRMSGAVSGAIKRSSNNTDLVKNNLGYTTENYGTCTITNSNVITVNHSLSTTPKTISITPIGQFVSYYVDSVTSTQFTLHIDKTTTASFYWIAFA